MIFVDSNVPMYLVGRPQPNRERVEDFVRANVDEVYVTSAEVYQEVIHRYIALDGRSAVDDCFELLDGLVQHVYSISKNDVERAREIANAQHRLPGRDCLHIAVMERYGLERVLTCDEDFDYWAGLTRLP